MSTSSHEETIREHYRQQAQAHGCDPTSSMLDQSTRQMEVSAILSAIAYCRHCDSSALRVFEIGCGNGYLLHQIRARFPDMRLVGLDCSPDMVAFAAQRQIENCVVREGNVCALDFEASSFDMVVSERCLINLLDQAAQDQALIEIERVLKPGGMLVLIEAFMDGLNNLNRARVELGLPENVVPHHNVWFDKDHFLSLAGQLFRLVETPELEAVAVPGHNFLSSHYFISRVLYPSLTKREVLYNTEFVKFFRFLPPMGDYSPIQLFLFRKPI